MKPHSDQWCKERIGKDMSKGELMNNDVHLDREKLMKEASVEPFPALYENAITKLEERVGIDQSLHTKLKAKRDFGFQKYGERSFQGSLSNAMATPSGLDLEEELIDAINYALHIQFQLLFKGSPEIGDASIDILNHLVTLHYAVNSFNTRYYQNKEKTNE